MEAYRSEFCIDTVTEEDGDESVTDELREKLQPAGIITCEFYFLRNTQRNLHGYGERKEIEELGSLSEKAVKGDALSYQAM